MGVKTQLSMIGALVIVSLTLLRWTPSDDLDGGRAFVNSVRGLSEVNANKASRGGGGGGEVACTTPNPPPVSVEWVGREPMIVSYSDKISVEVYRHDFPGSTLCALGLRGGGVAVAAGGGCGARDV